MKVLREVSLHRLSLAIGVSFFIGMTTLTGCSKEDLQSASESLNLDEDDVFSLKAGSCFNDPDGSQAGAEEISSVPMRECNEPHDNEAYFAFDLPDAPTYIETPEMEQQMISRCEQAFLEYVGVNYADSYYEYSVFTPTVESWAQNDREILCYLYDPEAKKIEQSLKNSKL